jgi:hypothetical protein
MEYNLTTHGKYVDLVALAVSTSYLSSESNLRDQKFYTDIA